MYSAWEKYYESVITPGYVLTATSAKPVDRNARGHAVLIFVGKPDSRSIIDDAIKASYSGSPAAYFPDAVSRIKKVDSSDYGFYLLLGQLFAIEQRWRRVVDLADQAIEVARLEREKKDPNAPMGREAFFLRRQPPECCRVISECLLRPESSLITHAMR